MNAPLQIVHGVLSLDVGGLERLVLALTGAACQRGHKVTVICVERPGQLAAEAERAGATVISLDKPSGRLPAYVEKSAAVLASIRPDVIHTHQIGAAWYLGPAAKRHNRPVVHTEHGNHFSQSHSWKQALKTRWLVRSTARNIDRFCCVSDEIAAAVRRWGTVPHAKVEVIPNGVVTEICSDGPSAESVLRSLGIPADAPVIGTVGRLAEVKQQGMLIRAFQQVRAVIPTAHLILVGDGPERLKLETLSRESGLVEGIHFAGYQSCPEQYFRIMDVFALTSRSEGFPVSLLEAWRESIAVVATAVGGIPKIVTHERDGLLIPSGDVEALTKSLIRLLGDREARFRLGRAGRNLLVERYSLGRMANEYESHYRSLVTACKGK